MSIELLTFDLDNTLWESREVLIRATKETETWIHSNVDGYSSLRSDRLAELRTSVMRDQPEISHDVSAFRLAFMTRCFREIGIDRTEAERLAKAAFEVFIHWRCQVSPYPAAEQLLKSLHADFKLASVTNGNADVTSTSLDQYFSFNLSAAEAGAAKPSPAIFQRALELGGVSDPANAIHIGDSLKEDIEGAANIGMKSVWLDHERTPGDSVATVAVHELTDVEGAIRAIDNRSQD